MTPALQWIEYLQKGTMQPKLSRPPTVSEVRISPEKATPEALPDSNAPDLPWNRAGRTTASTAVPVKVEILSRPPPVPQQPRRLPPIASGEAQSGGPSLPGISYDPADRQTIPTAPLPPPVMNSTIRPLPQVNLTRRLLHRAVRG